MTNADKLIQALEPEIDKKCQEIAAQKKEKAFIRGIIAICTAIIIVPAILVFFGVSFITIITPVLFVSVAMILLSAVLINQHGGYTYEQA